MLWPLQCTESFISILGCLNVKLGRMAVALHFPGAAGDPLPGCQRWLRGFLCSQSGYSPVTVTVSIGAEDFA
jgi:hypothetical protein